MLPAKRSVMRWALATSAIARLLVAPEQCGADTLQPGAQLAGCGSVLAIGPRACDPGFVPLLAAPTSASGAAAGSRVLRPPSPPPPRALPAADGGPSAPLAAVRPSPIDEVDAYLASYGKPSREAALALLDPSDDNIAAMVRREDETLAIAAYVGQRMTALRAHRIPDPVLPVLPGQPAADGSASDLPAMIRMQAVVVTAPDDREGWAAARALDRLAAAYPALDARLVLSADMGPRAAAIEVAAHALSLPVSVVGSGGDDARAASVVLTDLRWRRRQQIPARGLSGDQLRAAIVGLRQQARGR